MRLPIGRLGRVLASDAAAAAKIVTERRLHLLTVGSRLAKSKLDIDEEDC